MAPADTPASPPGGGRPRSLDSMICSFCGKRGTEVDRIIAGPAVAICNECVELCSEIIAEERRTSGPPDAAA